jgi:hydrogenase maturation protease
VTDARPLLVLGVGNVYYGDEGAGVHLAHYLRSKYAFPEGVDVIDGGTLGWDLLNLIAEYRHVVLIDAVAAPPGKVYRFRRGQVPDEIGYGKLSSHEWEVPDLLTAMDLYGDLPDVTIVAIGVAPLEFETGEVGVTLSDAVRGRMDALATVVLRELKGHDIEPRVVRPEMRADDVFTAEEIVLAHA